MSLSERRPGLGKSEELDSLDLPELREKIDEVDYLLLNALAQRSFIVGYVGEYKKARNIPPLDPIRWQEVVDQKKELAEQMNLDPDMVEEIYEVIHRYSLKQQDDLMDKQ